MQNGRLHCTQLRCDTASVARSFSGQSGWPGRLHATVELKLMEEAGWEQSWSSFHVLCQEKRGREKLKGKQNIFEHRIIIGIAA